MQTIEIFDRIIIELAKAKAKHPIFPKDVIHMVAIMAEKSGEAVQAAIDRYYDPEIKDNEKLKTELLQTAAMCIRCLDNME